MKKKLRIHMLCLWAAIKIVALGVAIVAAIYFPAQIVRGYIAHENMMFAQIETDLEAGKKQLEEGYELINYMKGIE